MAYRARILITVDNKQALAAIEQTATAAGVASDKIVVKDEEVAAANKRTSASFAEMKRGIGLVGTAAAAVLAFGMDKAVKSALAWQVQQTALQQAMRNTGTYSAAAVRSINAQAAALATHGGFAESQQIPAITALIAQTHSLTAAQNLNKAATNLARGAHMDYATAVQKIQGAEVGRLRGLDKLIGVIVPVTRYTYGWTAAMKAEPGGYANAVMMNKQATAQQILGRVQKTYGDQTSAYSRTVSEPCRTCATVSSGLSPARANAAADDQPRGARVRGDRRVDDIAHGGRARHRETVPRCRPGRRFDRGRVQGVEHGGPDRRRARDGEYPWQRALMAIALLASVVITHWNQIGGVITGIFHAIGSAVDAVGNAIKAVISALVTAVKWAVKLFNHTPLGGIFNFGKDVIGGIFSGNLNEIANAPGALLKGATLGR